MANICEFSMCVKGSSENIENFYKALCQDGNIHMGRGAEATLQPLDENKVQIDGWCKWSVKSALIDDAISMRNQPEGWDFSMCADPKTLEFITLPEACKKWDVEIEVFSAEPGNCFQEHLVINPTEIITNECVPYEEYFIDSFNSKEEAEAQLGIKLTNEEWKNEDLIRRGGFDSWSFQI